MLLYGWKLLPVCDHLHAFGERSHSGSPISIILIFHVTLSITCLNDKVTYGWKPLSPSHPLVSLLASGIVIVEIKSF